MTTYFITGTDTGVGKTEATLALAYRLRRNGATVATMKPVASGCTRDDGRLLNDDALRLLAAANEPRLYAEVNPYAYEPPIAPHIAALEAGIPIEIPPIVAQARRMERRANHLLIEGVGGWRVPLGPAVDLSDLVAELRCRVILVVGIRLGCLNHAILTDESIRHSRVPFSGWIASHCQPNTERARDNVTALAERIRAPFLGQLPFLPSASPEEFSLHLNLPDS